MLSGSGFGVRLDSDVNQHLRAFVHGVFLLAAFDVLPRCLIRGDTRSPARPTGQSRSLVSQLPLIVSSDFLHLYPRGLIWVEDGLSSYHSCRGVRGRRKRESSAAWAGHAGYSLNPKRQRNHETR